MIQVFLVDDNSLMRRALRQLIEFEAGLKICGEADSAKDALNSLIQIKPDIALIDISLGTSPDGIQLITHIREKGYNFPILTISLHEEALYVKKVSEAGAQGYLSKQDAPDHIVRAIQSVAGKREKFFTVNSSSRPQ